MSVYMLDVGRLYYIKYAVLKAFCAVLYRLHYLEIISLIQVCQCRKDKAKRSLHVTK